MRRNNRRKVEEDGVSLKKMLYISGTILALAVIAFVITFYVYGGQLQKTAQIGKASPSIVNEYGNSITEQASTQYGKTVNEVKQEEEKQNSQKENNKNSTEENTQKVAVNTSIVPKESKTNSTSSSNSKNTSNSTSTSKDTNLNNSNKGNTETSENSTTKIADPEFKMPVSGEIVKEFAQNKLVYSNTLDVWATHNGVDIKAEKTSVVKASAEGTVKSIKNDPRYGLTITIEHVNGYKTVYANLLSTEFVVEGEKVKQGQTIGTVGNTATFEISDDPHLHFELLKNNEQQDPELYLKK